MTDEPLDQQLTASLIGLLAVLEGQVRIGEVPLNVELRLRQRLVGTGLLPAREASGHDMTAALAALNQSLRRHEVRDWVGHPLDAPVMVNVVTFTEQAGAQAFFSEMLEQGKDVGPPVQEPAFSRWTVVIHYRDRDTSAPAKELQGAFAHGGQHLGAFRRGPATLDALGGDRLVQLVGGRSRLTVIYLDTCGSRRRGDGPLRRRLMRADVSFPSTAADSGRVR